MARQSPLSLEIRVHQTFQGFIAANPESEFARAALRRLVGFDRGTQQGDRLILVWGGPGSGKTHLATAAAMAAQQGGQRVAMLDVASDEAVNPQWLEAMHDLDFAVVEGLHRIAGDRDWEKSLFALLDRSILDGEARVVVTSRAPLAKLDIKLPDLVSRLEWGLHLPLRYPDEGTIRAVLQARADGLGLQLDRPVVDYLLRHYPRDLHSLIALLQQLDRESLAAQRRLTLPFVQSVLRARPVMPPVR